jgi:hypothetical protein
VLTTIKRALLALFPPSRPPDPGPPPDPAASPVPWIADEVWSAWQYWGSDPLPPDFPTIEYPDLFPADAADLERVPRGEVPAGVPVPPPGRYEELVQLLAKTPPSVGVRHPAWPMCCDRLATLINHQGDGVLLDAIEAEAGPLDRAFLIQDLRSNWNCKTEAHLVDAMSRGYADLLKALREDGVVEGLVIFQCRSCGRFYVGGCHP